MTLSSKTSWQAIAQGQNLTQGLQNKTKWTGNRQCVTLYRKSLLTHTRQWSPWSREKRAMTTIMSLFWKRKFHFYLDGLCNTHWGWKKRWAKAKSSQKLLLFAKRKVAAEGRVTKTRHNKPLSGQKTVLPNIFLKLNCDFWNMEEWDMSSELSPFKNNKLKI